MYCVIYNIIIVILYYINIINLVTTDSPINYKQYIRTQDLRINFVITSNYNTLNYHTFLESNFGV